MLKYLANEKSVVPLVTLTVIGFVLLALFISFSYKSFLTELETVLLEQDRESKKMQVISELMEVARTRTRITSRILVSDDVFEKDELNVKLNIYASKFSKLRQNLLGFPLSEKETSIIKSNDAIVKRILPAQRNAVELAISDNEGENERAEKLLYDVVLPGQEELIKALGEMIALEQERINKLTRQSIESLQTVKKRNHQITLSVLAIAIIFSLVVILHIRKIQADLRQSHYSLERAKDDLELKVIERTKELSELNQKLKDSSERDELTTLYNRRKFNIYLEEEYARTKRGSSCFSLILMDIDYFKKYNDNYGHVNGDQCLNAVAQAMKKSLSREIDFIARYGGEEFVIILPMTPLEGAIKIADRVRTAVVELNIPHEFSKVAPHVTISQGISEYHAQDNATIKDIINEADRYLYIAKENGRNRVAFRE